MKIQITVVTSVAFMGKILRNENAALETLFKLEQIIHYLTTKLNIEVLCFRGLYDILNRVTDAQGVCIGDGEKGIQSLVGDKYPGFCVVLNIVSFEGTDPPVDVLPFEFDFLYRILGSTEDGPLLQDRLGKHLPNLQKCAEMHARIMQLQDQYRMQKKKMEDGVRESG